MKRRGKGSFRRKAASGFKRAFKRARRGFGRSSKGLDLFDPIPVIYGFARPVAEQNLPKIGLLGAYSDNAIMALGAYGIHKFVKNKTGQDIARTMLTCEKFLVGNDLNAQFLGQTASKSNGGTGSEFVYG